MVFSAYRAHICHISLGVTLWLHYSFDCRSVLPDGYAMAATPESINISDQRISDGPYLTKEDLARRDRVVVFYQFDLQDKSAIKPPN